MTEPTDEEIERAERVRRLRDGEALPRRERRRPDPPEELDAAAADATGASESTESADRSGTAEAGTEPTGPHDGPLQPGEAWAPPDDAPDDLTVASLFLQEDLEAKLVDLERRLDEQYGGQYGDIDGPRHVRPLALYLGIRQIDKLDVGEMHALFRNIDEIEPP
ncbi:hypothetical protein BRC81_06895 [Halobacteriales archaeon QS_1_68_20]|nr:MAG: hypothetical protein BRC81_06895 [Halobacteriales archaeon QS_1_68_20]